MAQKSYAHTDPSHPSPADADRHWEPLFTLDCPALSGDPCHKCENLDRFHGHLNKVAWWAAKFAGEMFLPGSTEAKSARQWGYLTGLWHDLGKFAPEWQAYLRAKAGGDRERDERRGVVDHSTAGGQHAVQAHPILGHLLAYAITGHHAGLSDAISDTTCLDQRLRKDLFDSTSSAPSDLLQHPVPELPRFLATNLDATKAATFTRMLFSCLVDADFLATESFMSPERAIDRPTRADRLEAMYDLLTARIKRFGPSASAVDHARARVYEACVAAADSTPGLFSLTVPTGGGKTLSSLAFALKHALQHGQQRVIYVIPFTSIIEQNAAVFADIFTPLVGEADAPVVLEHHSNLSPEKETTRSRLAAENWDAPLVVTTAVQFYESLHAARTSQCRKLHHIANSVIILDEAQCLPVDFLRPCLDVLRELTAHYHSTVVLCTATQPAVQRAATFPHGLDDVREIIPDTTRLFADLRRVVVIDRGALSDATVAAEMSARSQCLAIVNTRTHARQLFQLLPESEENFHLSALMCPAHRREILASVRNRLEEGLAVRLVSTQLIEAGVDIDFPRVYRALAGIDSIAQAAGRCNRNGRSATLGETHLFRSEHQRAEAYFRDTADVAAQVLALHDDPLGLASIQQFFSLYYHQHNPPNGSRWDTKNISVDCRLVQDRLLPFQFQFRSIADKFRLIENDQIPVLIPYNEEAQGLLIALRNESIPLYRQLLRGLQSFTVQIRRRDFDQHRAQFESVRDGQFHILICPEILYSKKIGLSQETETCLII